MGELRDRMDGDLRLRGLSVVTRAEYLRGAARARHHPQHRARRARQYGDHRQDPFSARRDRHPHPPPLMHPHPKVGAPLESAQIFRRFAEPYRHQHTLADHPARVLRDIEDCRTAALGGHLYRCDDCGRDVPLYSSCLNRRCPTCQGPAQYHWIEPRKRRLLNTGYFHMVFTLPAPLRPVVFARRPRQFPPYAAARDGRCSTITASAPTAA